jgi:precorrin-8X/cobalt-precorrin-8 methylmutase
MTIHPIEVESYRIMRSELDFSSYAAPARPVVERMVHATADPSYATQTVVGEQFVATVVAAIRAQAPIVVDAHMVRLGITGRTVHCFLDSVPKPSPDPAVTRSALALRHGALLYPDRAIFVIGNAPTALFELLALTKAGLVRPAGVIGLPVGFVGAAESKAALRASPLASFAVSNVGRLGGSAVAAGALNALIRLADAG